MQGGQPESAYPDVTSESYDGDQSPERLQFRKYNEPYSMLLAESFKTISFFPIRHKTQPNFLNVMDTVDRRKIPLAAKQPDATYTLAVVPRIVIQ
jgi:hypothetical protein